MKRRLSAFTFIEMMVAITVFAIGVLAVLRLITQNLVSMDRTETRTMATFLAKEWIELTYNIRDANLQKWLPRNCLLTEKNLADIFETIDPDLACARYFSSGAQDNQALQLGFAQTGYFTAQPKLLKSDFAENFKAFRLWVVTGSSDTFPISRYAPSDDASSDATIFSRYILFKGVVQWWMTLPLDSVLKVESHVLFVKGTLTGEIILESFIGKQ